jgi:two-component system cell cycle sensor histidine kinase/response regulator CckA
MDRNEPYLDAVGQLACGLAHELNNILAVILSSTDLAIEANGDNVEVERELVEITTATLRAAQITRQLLAFGGKELCRPERLQLDEVVANAEPRIARTAGDHIAVAIARETNLHPIEADPSQLAQVINHLVSNACDAMPDGGLITIETANVGERVMLGVTDTGTGMTDAVRERIFDPFFTTKDIGSGTGLGLSSVLGIVRQSGGTISVTSEPGRGSTFRVYFPRRDLRAVPRERGLVVGDLGRRDPDFVERAAVVATER